MASLEAGKPVRYFIGWYKLEPSWRDETATRLGTEESCRRLQFRSIEDAKEAIELAGLSAQGWYIEKTTDPDGYYHEMVEMHPLVERALKKDKQEHVEEQRSGFEEAAAINKTPWRAEVPIGQATVFVIERDTASYRPGYSRSVQAGASLRILRAPGLQGEASRSAWLFHPGEYISKSGGLLKAKFNKGNTHIFEQDTAAVFDALKFLKELTRRMGRGQLTESEVLRYCAGAGTGLDSRTQAQKDIDSMRQAAAGAAPLALPAPSHGARQHTAAARLSR